MSVVIVLEGAGPGSFTVAVSPLAELSACLHALTESAHHPELRDWGRAVTANASAELRAGLRRFSPLWSALRWRGFYPGLDGTRPAGAGTGVGLGIGAGPGAFAGPSAGPGPGAGPSAGPGLGSVLEEQLRTVARLPIGRFAELTAFACVNGYTRFDFSRLLRSADQRAALEHAATALSAGRRELAAQLLRDPEACRADLLGFLDRCRSEFFAEVWAGAEPELTRSALAVRGRLASGAGRAGGSGNGSGSGSASENSRTAHTARTTRVTRVTRATRTTEDLAEALASLSPDSSRLGAPPRVVFDKLHHSVITPARTPVVLVPTRFNAPHLVVKNEPGLPPVLHYPIDAPEVGVTLARSRMLALTDPHRVRLCRLIAREPMTTLDLAARLSMTQPQVSRHLRALRDLGLVGAERSGRFVHYRLDLSAVERIGQDVVRALQH
ncbi:DUF5937 family protein [Streptomyces sp. NPDC059896]|uniref:ArsR/SmtB family transcription factor n=1 Tax=Streptomyces sp. NPDC059896 TaxID=3346993 RepID=UPI003669E35D